MPIGTLLYYHGGGYVIGDIDSHQAHAIRFADRSRVVVLNVDYRPAPEHPFPQGVNDAIVAALWASENLDRLGGADGPPALGGDSSGGNFAAVAAIRVRDAGIKIAAQVLIYGALGGGGGGGNPDIAYMYFGPDLGAEVRKAIEASPMLGELRGVAPAIIGVACATTVIRTASPTQRSCARLACRSSIARIQYSTTLTSCAMI